MVTAAIELIAAVGYPQASIAKIADRVGIAKSVVLYHFKSKDSLVEAIVTEIFTAGAMVMVPAIAAESTAAGKLTAYIRSNIAFLDSHRVHSVAMYEILTGFRTEWGLRLDQAAAESVKAEPPQGDMATIDPIWIFQLGVRNGEFRALSPMLYKNAVRAAIDGAVSELARDLEYDVVAYGEELVTLFQLGTRAH
ncbi:TetR family transcriptional regulator [Antrihabitans cavernicola]|uniref:TetR family transcriptional regulator n=1 Tax=Antrihabitans cavernicola TaxID=2495913 RepID=A0A5A7S7J9_9NOCA|nr:TetR family transcriptional regulator [Spelaeibacter cavernicola]